MENIIENLISQGPIGIVCAAIVYIVIYLQRKSTGDKRDKQIAEQDKRITLLETELEKIKALDLSSKLAQIMTDLQWLKERLK